MVVAELDMVIEKEEVEMVESGNKESRDESFDMDFSSLE
jgi:hypothetical protein